MKIKVILLAAAVILSACGKQTKQESTVHSVITVNPQPTDGNSSQSFAGIIEEGGEISVGFKTAGQINGIFVKEGDYVKQGQLIATLDDNDYRLGLDAAQIQYNQLKQETDRIKQLYVKNSVSGNDYDKAIAGLKQAEINLESNKNKVAYTKLYAPTSGYVQSVNFERSEMVNAGTPVITLLDTKQMEVVINIPSSLYVRKEQMKSFSCTGAFAQSESVKLNLISITPKADNNQLYRMRLTFPSGFKKATAGMNVNVSINMDDKSDMGNVTLPMGSVFEYKGKMYGLSIRTIQPSPAKRLSLSAPPITAI